MIKDLDPYGDIEEYMAKEKEMNRDAKREFLRGLIDKREENKDIPHTINHKNLILLISSTKRNFTNQTMNVSVSGKTLEYAAKVQLATIDSVLEYLNNAGLLKTVVKVDKTE